MQLEPPVPPLLLTSVGLFGSFALPLSFIGQAFVDSKICVPGYDLSWARKVATFEGVSDESAAIVLRPVVVPPGLVWSLPRIEFCLLVAQPLLQLPEVPKALSTRAS